MCCEWLIVCFLRDIILICQWVKICSTLHTMEPGHRPVRSREGGSRIFASVPEVFSSLDCSASSIGVISSTLSILGCVHGICGDSFVNLLVGRACSVRVELDGHDSLWWFGLLWAAGFVVVVFAAVWFMNACTEPSVISSNKFCVEFSCKSRINICILATSFKMNGFIINTILNAAVLESL